jgi:hypothetical protein
MTAEPWHDEHDEGAARQRPRRRPYYDLGQKIAKITDRQQQQLIKFAEITDRQRQELSELRQQLKELSELLNLVRQQHDVLVERLWPPNWTLRLETRLTVAFRRCITCCTLKPIDNFYPAPTRANPERRHRECKDCALLKQQSRHEHRTQRRTAASEPS